VRIEVIHPEELGAQDIARWRAFQAGSPSLKSPFFTPEWAQTIGAVRSDARIALIEHGAGFFPAQRLSRYAAMGLGAPIADYQGVVGANWLTIDHAKLCRALKVGRIDLTHVPQEQVILPRQAGLEGSWIVELEGSAEAYRMRQKQARREFVRQTDKKQRKIEKERGPLEFAAFSTDAMHLETLLCWKLAQLARSGQPPIWSQPWVRGVIDRSFAAPGHEFGGALFTMSIDGRLIAANYMLRSHGVLHDWIIAHDNEFDAYSPGLLLGRWAVEWAAENGFSEIDFGPGEQQYKRQLATSQRMLAWGAATRLSWSGAVRRAEFALRAGIERVPQKRIAALPGKAMRRLDLMRALPA
jgi:CelD/BcsL family acetyltransferase involved in cellulose biosynthesis